MRWWRNANRPTAAVACRFSNGMSRTYGAAPARAAFDGGHVVITQCDDHPARRARAKELGVRTVLESQADEYISIQLHPRDTGGNFFDRPTVGWRRTRS